MAGEIVILQPVLHPLLLALLLAPAVLLATRALVRSARAGATRAGATRAETAGPVLWGLRVLLLLACGLLLLRPGIPGGTTQTLATDTDVVLVVDTTASIVAEDWDGDEPRLDGVRQDVQSIVDAYPGARFALITSDASAELRLPLTTDTSALISSLEILRPEVTSRSQGSSIGVASRMLAETLSAAADSSPDRSRMAFYLGDGEQTAATSPESFAEAAAFVDGGAVLGYGTAEGGPMRETSLGADVGGYIQYQGADARSVIDEANLQTIADELGVPYQHRAADAGIELPEAPATTTDYSDSGSVGNVIELSWIVALAVVALLAVELALAALLLVRLRGLARAPASEDHAVPQEDRR